MTVFPKSRLFPQPARRSISAGVISARLPAVRSGVLNEQLVRTGWAVTRRSETTDYVAVEAEAKEKKLGLWQGEFMMPDAFRRAAGIFVNRP